MNRILIGKLKAEQIESFGGLEYVFPGGKIEENESEEKAVIREIQEETGLVCRIVSKIGKRIHPKTQRLIEYYHCIKVEGLEDISSSDNDDIEELVWIDLTNINSYMPTVFETVRSYLNSLNAIT